MTGYYDCARHEPYELTWYHEVVLDHAVDIGASTCFQAVYVNPRRSRNGPPPSAGACAAIERALEALRAAGSDAADRLIMSHEGGLEGRPHAVGGGWAAPGGVTFYVARCLCAAEELGCCSCWREFLCADADG